MKIRFTTTDNLFDSTIRESWPQLNQQKGDYDWGRIGNMCRYIVGGEIGCNWAWVDVDKVLIPMNIPIFKHWVLSVLDINTWSIEVYDSMARDGPHNEQLRDSLDALSNILPFLADRVGIFDIRQRAGPRMDPIPVTILDDLPRQGNG